MGPLFYIEYRGKRNRTIKGFYCMLMRIWYLQTAALEPQSVMGMCRGHQVIRWCLVVGACSTLSGNLLVRTCSVEQSAIVTRVRWLIIQPRFWVRLTLTGLGQQSLLPVCWQCWLTKFFIRESAIAWFHALFLVRWSVQEARNTWARAVLWESSSGSRLVRIAYNSCCFDSDSFTWLLSWL